MLYDAEAKKAFQKPNLTSNISVQSNQAYFRVRFSVSSALIPSLASGILNLRLINLEFRIPLEVRILVFSIIFDYC